ARKIAFPIVLEPVLEGLEQRFLPNSTVWTGAAGDSNWHTALNWSTGSVPGPADDAVIPAGFATIEFLSGSDLIHSLVADSPLTISGGSLSLASNSTIAATLQVTGSGSSFTANGPTTADGASLYVSGGGTLSLPGVTSYDADGSNPTLQASGSGSV